MEVSWEYHASLVFTKFTLIPYRGIFTGLCYRVFADTFWVWCIHILRNFPGAKYTLFSIRLVLLHLLVLKGWIVSILLMHIHFLHSPITHRKQVQLFFLNKKGSLKYLCSSVKQEIYSINDPISKQKKRSSANILID